MLCGAVLFCFCGCCVILLLCCVFVVSVQVLFCCHCCVVVVIIVLMLCCHFLVVWWLLFFACGVWLIQHDHILFLKFQVYSPEGRLGMSDVSLLSVISRLSFDSPFLSPLLFFLPSPFALSVLSFFSANGPFSWLFSRKLSNIFR